MFDSPTFDRYPVTQWFGERPEVYPEYGGHPGLDFGLVTGQKVYAIGPGTVVHAGQHEAWPGRGEYVVIDHGRYHSYYMHLLGASVVVGEDIAGSAVRIGLAGNTGWSTGPHLHLGIWDTVLERFVDPAPLVGLVREG